MLKRLRNVPGIRNSACEQKCRYSYLVMDMCSTNKCSYGNDNPYRMDYQGCKHLFPILYPIAACRVWGYLSMIGSTYLTLVLLPTGTIYRGTQPNTIQLKRCYVELLYYRCGKLSTSFMTKVVNSRLLSKGTFMIRL